MQAALNAQSHEEEKNNEVMDFLATVKLDKYADKFIDNGIEDLETILELQDQHLQ